MSHILYIFFIVHNEFQRNEVSCKTMWSYRSQKCNFVNAVAVIFEVLWFLTNISLYLLFFQLLLV